MNYKNLEEQVKNNASKIEHNSVRIHQNTGALEVLHTIKGYTNFFFVMWLITFIAFVVLLCFTIKNLYDTETIVTTTTQDVEQDNESGGNYYIGGDGDING